MGAPCPRPPLLLDEQVSPYVRVRHWRQIGRCPRWPTVAHDAVEVAWILRGGLRYRVGRRTHELGERRGFIVPDGHEHQTEIAPGTEAVSIWLDRQLLLDLEGSMGAGALHARVIEDPSVRTLAELMLEEARDQQPGSVASVEALGQALSVKLMRKATRPKRAPARDRRIHRVLAMIEAQHAEPLTVSGLAKEAGMSRYHFSRAFRAQTGLSPYQYLTRTRVRRGAELLRAGRYSVTEVALRVGFADGSRFARAFRRYQGCVPSAYSRTNRMALSTNRLA